MGEVNFEKCGWDYPWTKHVKRQKVASRKVVISYSLIVTFIYNATTCKCIITLESPVLVLYIVRELTHKL